MSLDGSFWSSVGLLGIIRFREAGDIRGAMAALAEGGIELVEVTLDTPGALAAVERAAAEGKTVGVGTVLTAEDVRASAAAGASFVVSPGHVAEVIETARDVTGKSIRARVVGRRDGDPPELVSGGNLARHLLGWTARRPALSDIVGDAWRFFVRHPRGFAP